ncbi:MAG: hypothetical protein M0Z81_10975 [Deltaproteobacteria bacterium]|nr:hypothetical protein [Deltaproteobacteria bacterium]
MDLHRRNFAFGFCPVSEDKRYDTAACSQLDNPVVLADARKPGEQDGIERKAISLLLLANDQLSAKKSVAG